MTLKTIAFIPLRGGSKSIPLKNIKPIAGRPLALWAIEAAAECDEIDRVFVSTDDERIRAVISAACLPKLEIVGRSAETASDTASTESAMLEFADAHDFEKIVLIQVTSPLLTSADLSAGLRRLDQTGADSLLSVVEQKRFIWSKTESDYAVPTNYDPRQRPRRQDFNSYYVENGAFYICRRSDLLNSRCRLSGRVAIHAMSDDSYLELDEPADWRVIESLLYDRARSESQSALALRAKKIKLVLMDVDGVLTDAGMYYSENGDEQKKFNTRDGKAIELLRKQGIKTGIITSENTLLVARRASKLKIDYIQQGAVTKMPALRKILDATGLSLEEVAYIGDDLADLPVLAAVGFSACPKDAVDEVKSTANYICEAAGGGGCVREFADYIIRQQQG